MSEATITVSQPKVINICSRLAKAQACSASELKGHATALEWLAKDFEIQYSLAVEARDEESIKVLQGQVAKDQGEIFDRYYKLFRQAVGLEESKEMMEARENYVESQYQETAVSLLDKAQSAMLLTIESLTQRIDELTEQRDIAFHQIGKLNDRINFILENFTMKRGAKSKSI